MGLAAYEMESLTYQLNAMCSHCCTSSLIRFIISARQSDNYTVSRTKARLVCMQHRKFRPSIRSVQVQEAGTASSSTMISLHPSSKLEEAFQQVALNSKMLKGSTHASTTSTNVSGSQTLGNTGPDPFTELHHLLEREIDMGVSIHQAEFTKEETKLVMEKLKETRKRGLDMFYARRKVLSHKVGGTVQEFSCSLDPKSLVAGEYVVHKSKGIGRFLQLHKEASEGPEYVILQYSDGMAKLKASQAARFLYRFHQPGDKGRPPALSKLSDPRTWEVRKSKSKLAAQKMVVDLLQLYVSRLKQKRKPYKEDGEDMRTFASKFPYNPTLDQDQAFADVRKDMVERETPMDRLICGDVGFGKTEVALRAIFRVFLAGKQVMVLAPTTVLARQHYNLICERFADYKARIALLSRFQTPAEKRDLAAEIKLGNLDIIVGTHALFSRNVTYCNLGMLVVDEEQRFGVKQKERIASLKMTVDVLTLSATPIPRTLYLALAGFRDASLITTPPPERVPIITHLLEYDEETMVAAIKFELSRNGQIYYVLPRIQGLAPKKAALQELFPGIRIGIAHGKQSASLLEETMDCFAQGESEILLCTNIIESGLDISRVNTIILEDVHFFGLAQVYQLRGRVGRADKESHAYLFYPGKDLLTDEALERLIAIEECCELGQGFQLAERDLAIRGFGSIFGEKQSGEAAHIGLDLFFDTLFETLSKADNHIFFKHNFKEVKLDLDVSFHSASDYIPDSRMLEKVISELETAACNGLKELMFVTNNLRCEFGRQTSSFQVILQAMYIRRLAADLGIHHLWVRGRTVVMESNMSETVFNILKESTAPDTLSSLTFKGHTIELLLLVELPVNRLVDQIFACLVAMRKGLSYFAKQ